MQYYQSALDRYTQHFPKLAPLALCFSLIHLSSLWPSQLTTILWIFSPSLLVAMCLKCSPQAHHAWFRPFLEIYAIYGVIISMLLTPLIIGLVGLVGLWLLETYVQNKWITIAWGGSCALLIIAGLTAKIFAPLLIFTQDKEINDALETSEKVVAKHFFGVYTLLLFVALLCLGIAATTTLLQDDLIATLVQAAAIFVVAPFSACLWLSAFDALGFMGSS